MTLGETSVLKEFQISNDILRKRCVGPALSIPPSHHFKYLSRSLQKAWLMPGLRTLGTWTSYCVYRKAAKSEDSCLVVDEVVENVVSRALACEVVE